MKIEAKNIKMKNIFSRRKYIIPDYQRNYSWSVGEEISIFWEDFKYYLSNTVNPSFFIGPMVFKGKNENATEFEVIDGQQRLITFSILLSVIISKFDKYKRHELSSGLKQYLIYKDENNRAQLVIDTIEPHPFFQRKIFYGENDTAPSKKSEQLIEAARDFFDKSIEEMFKDLLSDSDKILLLENIRNYLFNIDTVIIVSDDETDAFTIFETINTRGKDLSSLDLLKNYIFKNYPSLPGIGEPKNIWTTMVKNINIEREYFFNRFWASYVAKVTENKLYRRFYDFMRDTTIIKNKDMQDTKNLMKKLLKASDIYRKITNPLIDDWKIDKRFHVFFHIKNITGLFGLKVHIPFLLALFEEFERKNIKQSFLNEILLLMENFHFIFTHIVSARASGLDNKYSRYAIRLREEKNKDKILIDLRDELLSKLPQKDEYIKRFKGINYNKDKDTIKFILLRLEKEKDPSLVLDIELNSIEHLEPRSSKLSNVNQIGNLFLLEEKYNQDKDNLKPFDLDKKTKITVIEMIKENTKYKTTKEQLNKIIASKSWTKNDIEVRTESLAEETYKLFSRL